MLTKVPLVSRLTRAEQDKWITTLNHAIVDVDICRLVELSEKERTQVKVAIVANPDPEELTTLPNLEWVQSVWAGVEKLVNDQLDQSLKVVRLVDPRLSETMAEAALAWTFYLHRDMPVYRQQQVEGEWVQHTVKLSSERKVGVMGLGKLGLSVAETLKDAGFLVSGWSRSRKSNDDFPFECFTGDDGLLGLLRQSEILIVLLPLTAKTQGLLNSEHLGLLPRGASIINFARGPIVDAQGLIEHLDSQHLAHAVLDVFDQEPLPVDSPFWAHPNITVLPHIAAPTHKSSASKLVARHIHDYIEHGLIPDTVDKSKGY